MAIVVLSFFAPAFLAAQSDPIVVKVQKKESAQAQIRYAKILMLNVKAAHSPYDKHAAVAVASANLMAVERAWPKDSSAIGEANALLAQLYVDGEMPQNAVETADRGLARDSKDHRLYFAKGAALARMGKTAEAMDAFDQGEQVFDPKRGELTENVAAINTAAAVFEKSNKPEKASKLLRRAAENSELSPITRLTFWVAVVEQSTKAPDRGRAKKDLDALRDAYRLALGTSLTPAQRSVVSVAETTIRKFENDLR